MSVIEYVMNTGLSLVLLVFIGASVVFAKLSWDCYRKYKDYLFVVCSLGLFETFLMSLALLTTVVSQLFIGVAQ